MKSSAICLQFRAIIWSGSKIAKQDLTIFHFSMLHNFLIIMHQILDYPSFAFFRFYKTAVPFMKNPSGAAAPIRSFFHLKMHKNRTVKTERVVFTQYLFCTPGTGCAKQDTSLATFLGKVLTLMHDRTDSAYPISVLAFRERIRKTDHSAPLRFLGKAVLIFMINSFRFLSKNRKLFVTAPQMGTCPQTPEIYFFFSCFSVFAFCTVGCFYG